MLAWLFAAVAGPSVWAQAESPEEIVVQYLQGLGAVVSGAPARMFLQQGESRVLAQSIERGCVGFLAFGTGSVRDVDLSIHTEGGLLLDEDVSAAPYAYVRGCSGGPQTWFVSASLYAGRGELLLLRMEHAPESVGLLPFGVGLAAPSGGRPERPRRVGPSLPGVSEAQRLEAQDRAWAARGYTPGTVPLDVPLESGLGRVRLPLEVGFCYAIVVNSPVSRHTAVVVAGPAGSRWTGAASGSEAVVYACPRTTDMHAAFVRAQPGGQRAVVRAFVQMDARHWDPGTQKADRARALVGELTYLFERRGLHTEVVGEGWVDTVGPLRWPVPMQADHCYGLGVVALGRAQRGRVEIALEGPDGRLVSRHRRRDGPPYVFHCAAAPGVHTLVIRASGEVGVVAVVRADRAIGRDGGPYARR